MTRGTIGLMTRQETIVPLTGVEVQGTVTGRAARVKVSQRFRNAEDTPVEAVYKFPLPENAALCSFKAIIGDRTIAGEVKERDKAFAEFDDALAEGHGAFLLDEERPNIFTLSVGNLLARQEATIEIEYVNLLPANGAEVRFFLPTTISPRYVPPGMPDQDGIPVNDIVNPDFALHVSYGLKITLDIQGKDAIAAVECPSHSIVSGFASDSIRVEFASGTVAMDRDFVLNIRYRKGSESRGFVWSGGGASFVQADVCYPPDDRSDPPGQHPREIVFVLDCSGSMTGSSIAEARLALQVLLRALGEKTAFNIYRFGSTFEKLFPCSQPYDPGRLETALAKLQKTEANLGGTQVLEPLMDIYSCPAPDGRDIVLITDAQIGNEAEVIQLVKQHAHNTRLFTVGIGYGPNEYFIKQGAGITGGSSETVAPGERVESKVLRLYRKMVSDSITGLVLKTGDHPVQAPASPSVFEGETITVLARLDGARTPNHITVSGSKADGQVKWELPLAPVTTAMPPLPVLWARERIRDLEEGGEAAGSRQAERKARSAKKEIVELSQQYGVISRETSFLAIETRPEAEKVKGEIVLRKIPVPLTYGWHGIHMPDAQYLQAPPTAAASFQFMTSAMGGQGVRDISPSVAPLPAEIPPPQARATRMMKISRLVRTGPIDNLDELLFSILLSQRREGGFDLHEDVIQALGLSRTTMDQFIADMKVTGDSPPDAAVLLATAIALCVLENKFADRRNEWQAIAGKSERWFQAEVARTRPEIAGVNLVDRVADWLGKLNLRF
ncbi:MAG: VWA domain-containing protein [Chloroflexi bacterium]|nr:VWA domain-containing protein [Chloroflexota bacterium]